MFKLFFVFFISLPFHNNCCGVLCSWFFYKKQQDKNYGTVIHLSKLIYICMNTFSITFFSFFHSTFIFFVCSTYVVDVLPFILFLVPFTLCTFIWKDIGYTLGVITVVGSTFYLPLQINGPIRYGGRSEHRCIPESSRLEHM